MLKANVSLGEKDMETSSHAPGHPVYFLIIEHAPNLHSKIKPN